MTSDHFDSFAAPSDTALVTHEDGGNGYANDLDIFGVPSPTSTNSMGGLPLNGTTNTNAAKENAPADPFAIGGGHTSLIENEKGDDNTNDLDIFGSSAPNNTNDASTAKELDIFSSPAAMMEKMSMDEAPNTILNDAPTGRIMMRSSLSSFISKDWKEMHWLKLGDTTLLIFRTMQDALDYKIGVSTGSHPLEECDKLVKLRLDFCHALAKKNVKGYTFTKLSAKKYMGAEMFKFTLEGWYLMGPKTMAAFASRDESEAKKFMALLIKMYKDSYAMKKPTFDREKSKNAALI